MIPIYETFYSWQGEGVHFGRAAYFIRTYGCPVKCTWCDSAGTWHPDYTPDNIEKRSEENLVKAAKGTQCDFVVITGGEPTIFDLNELTAQLEKEKISRHLETSGGFEIKGDFQWITVSPKREKLPLDSNLRLANELKIIVDGEAALEEWKKYLKPYSLKIPIWLNIEWSLRDNKKLKEKITTFVKEHGFPYRVGYQFHKLFLADEMDGNSKPNAPLGGNLDLGY